KPASGGVGPARQFAAEHGDAVDRLLEVRGKAPVADRFDAADVERGAGPEPEPRPEALARFEGGGAGRRGLKGDGADVAGADEGDSVAGLRLGGNASAGPELPGQGGR